MVDCPKYSERSVDCCGLRDTRSRSGCNGDLMLCNFPQDSRVIPVVEEVIEALPKTATWARYQLQKKYLD